MASLEKQIEEKRKRAFTLRCELNELEQRHRQEELIPKLKQLVGTYWTYRNSYSCPGEESDYWQIYRRVSKVDDNGTVHTDQFEIDKYGELRAQHDKTDPPEFFRLDDSWKKITRAKYYQELRKVKALVVGLE